LEEIKELDKFDMVIMHRAMNPYFDHVCYQILTSQDVPPI